MTPQRTAQTVITRRRRVSIEIYFVLYLSAIILLLGTTPSQHASREEGLEDVIRHLLASDFRVKAEKAALVYSVIPAGAGVDTTGAMLKRDSINTVTALGTFSSVRFSIVSIEDSASGKPVPTGRATLLAGGDRSAIFQWAPSATDHDAVYRITVAGTATPLPPENLRPELRDRVNEILQRNGTVSDTVTFTITVFALRDMASIPRVVQQQTMLAARNDSQAPTASVPPSALVPPAFAGGPFQLSASQTLLPMPAGSTWSNQINLSGPGSFNDMTLETKGAPTRIAEQSATRLMLTGTTPAAGTSQEITLTATRKSDGQRVSVSFGVRSVAPDPIATLLPSTLLAGQSYALNFTPAGIESRRVAVEVTDNDRTVVDRSEYRSSMRYVAPESGKVKFARYLDGQLVDQTTVDVRPLPAPSVLRPPTTARDAQEVRITTITYGTLNGQPNRGVLKIKSGNAEEPTIESEDADEQTKQIRQVWRVHRRDRQNEFRFRMYVIDQRGSRLGKSQEVDFVAAE
ncbi:MAG TPA: hypothetical protein VHI13_04405 [Candidatus Kapabacteria bacterium]|nr:hypothetical protein [Candidatus Kapabacteria bacterium]